MSLLSHVDARGEIALGVAPDKVSAHGVKQSVEATTLVLETQLGTFFLQPSLFVSLMTSLLRDTLDVANTTVILGETTYAYTPVIDFLHIGTKSLYSSIYMLPRQPGSITLTT